MSALIIGIVFLLFTVFAVLPFPWALQWWPYVLDVIQGALPLLTLIVGGIAVLIGIADIRDRAEEKREKEQSQGEHSDES
jgi:hypothetical protein